MHCDACGTENEAGAKFCARVRTALTRSCPSCIQPQSSRARSSAPSAERRRRADSAQPATTPVATPAAERRLVSVLFADLVGFTDR